MSEALSQIENVLQLENESFMENNSQEVNEDINNDQQNNIVNDEITLVKNENASEVALEINQINNNEDENETDEKSEDSNQKDENEIEENNENANELDQNNSEQVKIEKNEELEEEKNENDILHEDDNEIEENTEQNENKQEKSEDSDDDEDDNQQDIEENNTAEEETGEEEEEDENDDENNENPKELAWKKVVKYIEKKGIKGFSIVGKRTGTYAAQIDGITNMITVRVKRKMFLLKIRFPIEVPPQKRDSMAELIARINYNMLLGSFQMDMNDGELFYFHANSIGDKLNESIIAKNIAVSQMTIHQHAQKFSKLIYTDKTPVELLQQESQPPQGNLMQALLSALGSRR